MTDHILAVDFGTSNSAAAWWDGARVRRIPVEQDAETLPTAVFFPAGGGPMQIGNAATRALIEGQDGRYMRALKSVLGTSLFHEKRTIGGRRQTLADIVTAFLGAIRQRAEEQCGVSFSRVLSGRPVHFHSGDPTRDRQAEDDLRACYRAAGFKDVRFLFEPEAAAHATYQLGRSGAYGLIVDIGGGTSDFTVFESAGDRLRVLASNGIRLGGTDLDHAISMMHAMPLLGRGGQLRRAFGDELLPVPNAIYADLSTWSKIPFLYAPETRRAVADLVRHAVEPHVLARLGKVIEDELGHELAFAVEAAKIGANSDSMTAHIEMQYIEPGLAAPLSAAGLSAALRDHRGRLRAATDDTLRLAGLAPERIGSVILVGGSSLMRVVPALALDVCRDAELQMSDAFTAVVDGLAIASRAGNRPAHRGSQERP